MSRFAWDNPASEVFKNLPSDISFRVWTYQYGSKHGFDVLATVLNKAISKLSAEIGPVNARKLGYQECTAAYLKSATERVGKTAQMNRCPRCNRLTTSTRYCSQCQKDAQQGRLTPRERERLQEHYRLAHMAYAETANPTREDEYTRSAP